LDVRTSDLDVQTSELDVQTDGEDRVVVGLEKTDLEAKAPLFEAPVPVNTLF
jgi:hypothetical protein